MERVYRLTTELACLDEPDALPTGALVLEPRRVGGVFVFLASVDGGRHWRQYVTLIDCTADWFELVSPAEH
jgi:hypothetical protein